MRRSILCGVLLVISTATQAANWKEVARSKDAVTTIDMTRLGQIGRYRSAWVKSDSGKHMLVALTYFNCAARTSASKKVIVYSNGQYLSSSSTADAELHFTDDLPGSVGGETADAVCSAR